MLDELIESGLRFGVGVDVEEVARWRALVAEMRPGTSRWLLFHAEEHEHCRAFADPAPVYAGRWCAKEAVFKALTEHASLDLRDVMIVSGPSGRPEVVLLPDSLRKLGLRVRVSISHTDQSAIAMAVAVAPRGAEQRRG
jgi:fatty acid synthase subunit alpha